MKSNKNWKTSTAETGNWTCSNIKMSNFLETERKLELVKLHTSLKNVSPRGGAAIVEVISFMLLYLADLA